MSGLLSVFKMRKGNLEVSEKRRVCGQEGVIYSSADSPVIHVASGCFTAKAVSAFFRHYVFLSLFLPQYGQARKLQSASRLVFP